MTTIRFPQPAELLNLNQRWHWARKAKVTKAWRTTAGYCAPKSRKLPPSEVHVTIDVADRRRRDPSNLFPTVKAIVDGLVDAGLWPDDNADWVTVGEPRLRIVGRKQQLWVEIAITPRRTA